jgi:hypothetical protein
MAASSASGSTPCRFAQVSQTLLTTAEESRRVPSMSNKKAA